jgi:hypothetical protein
VTTTRRCSQLIGSTLSRRPAGSALERDRLRRHRAALGDAVRTGSGLAG